MMGFRVGQVRLFQARLRGGRFPLAGNLNAGLIADNASSNSRHVHNSSSRVHSSSGLPATTTPSATSAVLSRVGFQADRLDTKGTLANLGPMRHTSPRNARRWSSRFYSTAVERASITSTARRPTVRDSTHLLQPLWTQFIPPMAGAVQCLARSNRRAFSSSSDDTSSKKPEGVIEGDEKVDLPPTVEAEVIEPEELKQEQPRHVRIKMPAITDVSVFPSLVFSRCKLACNPLRCGCCHPTSRPLR